MRKIDDSIRMRTSRTILKILRTSGRMTPPHRHRFHGQERQSMRPRSAWPPKRPVVVGERRIRDHVIVGAELFAVLELWIEERVSRQDVRRWKVVEDHVHAGEARGGARPSPVPPRVMCLPASCGDL